MATSRIHLLGATMAEKLYENHKITVLGVLRMREVHANGLNNSCGKLPPTCRAARSPPRQRKPCRWPVMHASSGNQSRTLAGSQSEQSRPSEAGDRDRRLGAVGCGAPLICGPILG